MKKILLSSVFLLGLLSVPLLSEASSNKTHFYDNEIVLDDVNRSQTNTQTGWLSVYQMKVTSGLSSQRVAQDTNSVSWLLTNELEHNIPKSELESIKTRYYVSTDIKDDAQLRVGRSPYLLSSQSGTFETVQTPFITEGYPEGFGSNVIIIFNAGVADLGGGMHTYNYRPNSLNVYFETTFKLKQTGESKTITTVVGAVDDISIFPFP